MLFFSLLVTGCTPGSIVDKPGTTTPPPIAPNPTPALPSGLLFPQRELVNGELPRMTSEIDGTLGEVNGCLRLNSSGDGTSYLIIWPPQYLLAVENGQIQIRDETGQVLALVGQEIHRGGGIGDTLENNIYVPERLIQEILPECPGPYWIGGSILPDETVR